MQVNGILGAKWMQSASCCVLLGGAVQAERDVLHVAGRSGASREGHHPARCLEKRRRWRGPSCMLLGGAVRVERRPACCWVERCKRRGRHPACCLTEQCGWWGNVGNVEEAYAPNTRRFTPRACAASRRRCTPRARRYRLETIAYRGDIRFAPLLCTKVHFSKQAL